MNSVFQVLKMHRFLKYILIGVSIIALLLLMLPFAFQWGVQYTLKEQGARSVSIEDVNLNLFNGKFELKQLRAAFSDAPELSLNSVFVDIDMAALWGAKIIVENVLVDGLQADIKRNNQGVFYVNGYAIVNAQAEQSMNEPVKKPAKPFDFALKNTTFTNIYLRYSEQDFEQNIKVQYIQFDHLVSWKKQEPSRISLLLNERDTTIKVDMQAVLLADVKSFEGELKLAGLQTQVYKKFYQQQLQKLNAQVNIEAQFDLKLDETLSGSINHYVVLNELQAQYRQLDYQLEKLSASGQMLMADNALKLAAEVTLNNSQLRDMASASLLNSFKYLALTQLHYDASGLRFDDLSLTGINVLENKTHKALLSLNALSIKQLYFDAVNTNLQIKEIELQQPDINATLSGQKQLTHLALLEPVVERFRVKEEHQNSQPATKVDSSTPALQMHIEKVRLTKPGLLHFNDLSVTPHYSTTLHFNRIDINNVSNSSPADFNLGLKQGDYTSIDITGQGLLFNPAEHLAYTIDIKQLDLPPVSSYTTQTMGYGVKSGVVNSVIKGSIKQSQIDTRVTLSIDSIEVVETDKETAAEISGASGMSIDLALSTLKDKNNVIDLEMPIGGNIEKPDFDLSLIINKAMGVAMKAATLGYLKHALQPFSGLVSLFSMASDVANSIALAPVHFTKNKTQLAPEQKQLLDKVSGILIERPGIKIKACGIAALADQKAIRQQILQQKKQAYLSQTNGKKLTRQQHAALDKINVTRKELQQAMKTLADVRAANVKAYLIKEKNIKAEKILNCLSAENLTKDSKPVVELVI